LQRTGFLLLPVAEDRVLFLFPFVEDRVFIAPCCRGEGFYCYLLQRTWFLLLPVAEDRVLLLFPFVESRVFIAPCCRGLGSFLVHFCRGQGFYCSLL
jgi:hypothetical protein